MRSAGLTVGGVDEHGGRKTYPGTNRRTRSGGTGGCCVQFIASMGFNLARVSITYSGVAPTPGSFDQSYVNSFVSFDQELAGAGIYDLLDMMQGEYSQAIGGW